MLEPWLQKIALVFPALMGGVLDYLRQVNTGEKEHKFWTLVAHLVSSVFFGWLCGTLATGLGYNTDIAMVCAGSGGFLGVRVADIGYLFIQSKVAGKDERA